MLKGFITVRSGDSPKVGWRFETDLTLLKFLVSQFDHPTIQVEMVQAQLDGSPIIHYLTRQGFDQPIFWQTEDHVTEVMSKPILVDLPRPPITVSLSERLKVAGAALFGNGIEEAFRRASTFEAPAWDEQDLTFLDEI